MKSGYCIDIKDIDTENCIPCLFSAGCLACCCFLDCSLCCFLVCSLFLKHLRLFVACNSSRSPKLQSPK